jgi:NAD(P)-dependent dehydrogenase (short-subunit alcohol dehydrogenase family)
VRSEEAKKTLVSEGVIAIQLEVTSDESIQALHDEISERVQGKLDILINNVYALGPLSSSLSLSLYPFINMQNYSKIRTNAISVA